MRGVTGTVAGRRQAARRIVVGAAALAGAPALVRSQSRRLKVGVLLPRTGPLAPIGLSCLRGAEAAFDVVRELQGVELEPMHVDCGVGADVARSRAERLINDGAQAIVAPVDSSAASGIARVCEQRRIPLVVTIASAPQLTEQGWRYTFRNFPTSIEMVRNGLSMLRPLFQATRSAPRRAVLIHPNDAFGQANRQAIESLLPGLDFLPFRLVDAIGHPPGARELTNEIARAKSAQADLVLSACRLDDAVLLLREMNRLRFDPQGVVSAGAPGLYEEALYRTLGRQSDYCVSNVPWYDPRSRVTAAVERAFARRHPNERLMFHALNVGYTVESVLVLADAFRRAGSGGGTVLAEALRRTDLASRMMFGEPIRFDAKGQVSGSASACIQNRNQRPTLVLPTASAEIAPVFPMPSWERRG